MAQNSVNTENNRMFYIEYIEKMIAEKTITNRDANRTLILAYDDSVSNKNNYLNFYYAIEEKDIEPIVDACRKNGIKEFTISSTYSGVIKTLEAFEKQGCKLCGLARANKLYGRETVSVPAIKLQVL